MSSYRSEKPELHKVTEYDLRTRLIITGASGFIGRQVVPRLVSEGYELLLVGRKPETLKQQFPGMTACDYENLAREGEGFDALMHLAVLNNNAEQSEAAFEVANVELTAFTLSQAKLAGVARFINISSFHALADKRSSYGDSKRKAAALVERETGIATVNLYLPAVHGTEFAGKLSFLRAVPALIRPPILSVLSAFVPTLNIDQLVHALTLALNSEEKMQFAIQSQQENWTFRAGKACMDVGFALTTLVLLSWLLLACWIWIRIDSPGPAIFAQERIGKGGKPFTCYKFRTMQLGVKQAGTHEVSASSVTRSGEYLRKYKIDELPQAVNLLRREMSLIGPRPCLPVQTRLIDERKKRGVLDISPGISGLAQVAGVDMSDPVKLARLDQRYVAMRSLILDIKLAILTFLGGGRGDRTQI